MRTALLLVFLAACSSGPDLVTRGEACDRLQLTACDYAARCNVTTVIHAGLDTASTATCAASWSAACCQGAECAEDSAADEDHLAACHEALGAATCAAGVPVSCVLVTAPAR